MRVLITTWVFPTHGGVFAFLERLIPPLQEGGHEFHVVAIQPSRDANRDFPHLPAGNVHAVSQMRLPRPLSFPFFPLLFRTLQVCRDHDVDVIFCQDPLFSGFSSLLASTLLGIPLVSADHGMVTNIGKKEYWANFSLPLTGAWRSLTLALMARVFRASRAIYSPGDDVTARIDELFGQATAGKAKTLAIGIDTELYRPDPTIRRRVRMELGVEEEIVVTFVGRLHVESGLEYLIEAAARLQDRDVRYLVVGDGVLRKVYEGLAADKTPARFVFLGYSDRVHEILNASDIFAFPKVFAGGVSIALREAMATGLPVIATSGVDSHDQILRSGENGILVSPGDSESLAEALTSLLDDAEKGASMGRLAREEVIRKYGARDLPRSLEELLRGAEKA